MNSEHNPSIHWGWRSHPVAGSTIHNQELCHQAKSHYHAWWRAATPFLTSACTTPRLQFSRGKVWIQVCLLCLELSSCSVSSDILCPALHWPGTCAAQMPGTAFIRGPHSGCCSTPPPVLSVKDCHTFVLSMAPHLSVDTFCKSQDFAFVFHIRGVSCRQGPGYQITPTVSSGKESSVAFCLARQEIFAQVPLPQLSGFLTCESSTV